jgi:hypothetical protein
MYGDIGFNLDDKSRGENLQKFAESARILAKIFVFFQKVVSFLNFFAPSL